MPSAASATAAAGDLTATLHHAVLTLGHGREDGAYTVYDPQMRDDGQVVMDSAELDNYKKAESVHIEP